MVSQNSHHHCVSRQDGAPPARRDPHLGELWEVDQLTPDWTIPDPDARPTIS
jgi:hypothetical protein